MKILCVICFVCFIPLALSATAPIIYALDENWVCNVKKSCLDCLRLSQCSWCQAENVCFSRNLPTFKDFCSNNFTEYQSYGLSFVENAECACADGQLEENCYPPGVTEGPKCTGRGDCVCGQCNCTRMPDPEHPTKMVVGEYCQYDNFSCDGPRCNEGPYLYNDPKNDSSAGGTQAEE